MRNLVLAALALAPIAAASAQPARRNVTPPPPALRLDLTDAQQAELRQAVARGRSLAVLLDASRVSTRDMLMRIPAAQRDAIVGWVAQPEGNGVIVTYFARQGDGYAAMYRGQVLGGRVTSPQVYAEASRPALSGVEARMAAARMAAEAQSNQPCGGTVFNTVVLPPEGEGPVLVYKLSPRANATSIPTGGHYRLTVAADGSVSDTTPLAERCDTIAVPEVPAGQRPRPLVVNARNLTLPNELHVFMAAWTGRPLAVATGTGELHLWGVTPQGIAELQQ